MAVNMGIFRAYDIRGVYPDEIHPDIVRLIANATARFLRSQTVIVGEDVRTSSPSLRAAVIDGLTAAGCDVVDIGQCTTPLFYFAVNTLESDGGIMITASHNPPQYNGLKIVRKKSAPVDLMSGLGEIRRLASEGYHDDGPRGEVEHRLRIADEYIDFLKHSSTLSPGGSHLKAVVDTAGGAASIVMQPLLDGLGIHYTPIMFDIDGTFARANPNPLAPGALDRIGAAIHQEKADVGLAFDGDGDRLVVVDEKGHMVDAQYILALLWQAEPSRVVYDLRFSRDVRTMVGDDGVRSKVGHSNMVEKMIEHHAMMGAEMSGHFFFGIMNGRESSALAALKVLALLERSQKPLSELVADITRQAYSGEHNIEFYGDFENVKKHLKDAYSDGTIDELDGLTVEYDDWWFNIRASNTESVIRLVVEAKNQKMMKENIAEIRKTLE